MLDRERKNIQNPDKSVNQQTEHNENNEQQNNINNINNETKRKPKKKRNLIKLFFKTLGITLLSIIIIAVITVGGAYVYMKPTLDNAKEQAFEKMSQIDSSTFMKLEDTEIYDKDNNKIGEINTSNYKYANIASISKYITDGYIAVEDNRFATHNGIDLKAIVRAAKALIENDGVITQGGSTITQQVLKNNVIGTDIDKWERKFIELFLAPEFEKAYTKSDIMEFYCNSNFYGNGCYGVETASNYYFGKSAKDLTLAQAATLVGVSNSPSRYDPVDNPDDCIARRDFVLSRMLELEKITQEQYDEAKAEEITLVLEREAKVKETNQVSFAIHCGALKLMELDGFKFKYSFSSKEEFTEYTKEYNTAYREKSEKIRNGGYIIKTSLDSNAQSILQDAVDKALVRYTERAEDGRYTMQGAATIVDNSTGYVVAIVGGRGTDDEYNRGFLSPRQPGSAIKPIIVYGPAFDTGRYYPSLIMNDKPIKDGPANAGGGYRGRVTIREAVARSLNTVPYNILQELGPSTGVKYLADMRFDNMSYLDTYNGSLALGGFTYGVTTFEMAKAYATVAMGGKYVDENCLMEMQFNGENLYKATNNKKSVYTEDTAYMLIDVMKGVVNERYGTAYGMRIPNTIIAGKTGTTNDNKDGWFCGVSTYYSLAAWCGYDQPRAIPEMGGGKFPADIFRYAMTELHKDLPEQDFKRPSTVEEHYVDRDGNKTDRVTWDKDIFSMLGEQRKLREEQEAREKAERERKEAELREQSNYNLEANKLISEISEIRIREEQDVYKLDNKYEDAQAIIQKINDTSLRRRLAVNLDEVYDKANLTDIGGKIRFEIEDAKRKAKEAEEELERKKKAEEEERKRLEAERQRFEEEQKKLQLAKKKPQLMAEVNKCFDQLRNWKTQTENLDSIIDKANKAVLAMIEYEEYNELCKTRDSLVAEIMNYYNNIGYIDKEEQQVQHDRPTINNNGDSSENEQDTVTVIH